jgi:FeS assembly SUF system regulator
MLRLSKLADYATVVMVYLARRESVLCSAKEIAHYTHLTIPTVSKILKKLTKEGLLKSTRGPAGGYQLKRPAVDISVAQIIFALEERTGLTECSIGPSDCSIQSICNIKGNWRLINEAIERALDTVSLHDLAKTALSADKISRITRIASGVESG